MEMMEILKKTYSHNSTFIPFQMKSKDPDAFARVIHQHSKLISAQRTISLQYFTSDVMYYLSNHIQATAGVLDLVEVSKAADIGKYKVLVKKTDHQSTRQTLKSFIRTWISEHVPDDAKPAFELFPGDSNVNSNNSDA